MMVLTFGFDFLQRFGNVAKIWPFEGQIIKYPNSFDNNLIHVIQIWGTLVLEVLNLKGRSSTSKPSLKPLSDIFSILSRYLSFSGYFDSIIRGTTFVSTFCNFAGQISYPFDFISWRNLLVQFYSNSKPVDLICVILHQTHFLQVPVVCNITSHTVKGLISSLSLKTLVPM